MKTANITQMQMWFILGTLYDKELIAITDVPEVLHEDLRNFLTPCYGAEKAPTVSFVHRIFFQEWATKLIRGKGFDYAIEWLGGVDAENADAKLGKELKEMKKP